MRLQAAALQIGQITLAAILVSPEQTYPAPGGRLISEAQRYFPTLPIILLSPRIGGFSRSFAHFDTSNIIKHINTDLIDWRPATLPTVDRALPF